MTGATRPTEHHAEPAFLQKAAVPEDGCRRVPACPACGGPLVEIRHKLQCGQCHTICETCCEGGRG